MRYFAVASAAKTTRSPFPRSPSTLNELLATQDFCAGIEPQIGRKHMRVIALDGFPRSSFPGMLGEIDSLPMEYRWSTRAILLDPEEARSLLDKSQAEVALANPRLQRPDPARARMVR